MTPDRLAELTALRANRKDPQDLPGSMTPREVAAYTATTATLDHRIAAARAASDALATLRPAVEADQKWLAHLTSWRETLASELEAIHTSTAKVQKDAVDALTFSLKLVDRGLNYAPLGVVSLASTRIGSMMSSAGYAVEGASLLSPAGWRGSLADVERRLRVTTGQMAAAEAALANALLSDDEQAERDQAREALRTALNTMKIQNSSDGSELVAFALDGSPLPVEHMNDTQRAAFDQFAAAHFGR